MLKIFKVEWDRESGVLRLYDESGKEIVGAEAFIFFSQWREESNFPPAISFSSPPVKSSGLKASDDDLLQLG